MIGYCAVIVLMVMFRIQFADSKTAGPLFSRFSSKDTSSNIISSTVLSLVKLMESLQWNNAVVFHDQSKERHLTDLLNFTQIHGNFTSVITFETTESFWKNTRNHLTRLHQLLFPNIHVVVLCDENNASRLLNQVIQIDLQHGSILDYRHNSFWLVLTGLEGFDRVKNSSSLLENIAVVAQDFVKKNKPSSLHKSRYRLKGEKDRYISAAYGLYKTRSWHWFQKKEIRKAVSDNSVLRLLYPNTQYNHNRRELRVIFREISYCVHHEGDIHNWTFTGYCIDIFHDLVSSLNFSYIHFESLEETKEHKDNWITMEDKLKSGEADICVTEATITSPRMKMFDYILPNYLFTKLVLLYRRGSARDLNVFRFLEPFRWEVYVTLVSAVLITSLAYILTESYISDSAAGVPDILFHFCGIILQQGGSLQPSSWTARTLISTFWLCSVCLAATYSAYLTASLTVINHVQPFTDLSGLLKRTDYKVGIARVGASMKLLKNSQSGINKELWDRIARDNDSYPPTIDSDGLKQVDRVLKENYAVVVTETFAQDMSAADCRLDYLKESILWVQGSFLLRKGLPYKHDLNKKMTRLIESNAPVNYRNKFIYKKRNRTHVCELESITSVSTQYLVGILSCLAIGLVASVFVLCVEIAYTRLTQWRRTRLTKRL